jgi:sirohydrochlorin ferrochelatase
MPALGNARHERFAQEIARGKSQSDAYGAAGFTGTAPTLEAGASRLIRNDKVKARVAELLEFSALRAEVSIATLTQDLLRLRDKGEALADAAGLSVARNSVMDIAKLNGLVVDKTQGSVDHAHVIELIGVRPG